MLIQIFTHLPGRVVSQLPNFVFTVNFLHIYHMYQHGRNYVWRALHFSHLGGQSKN